MLRNIFLCALCAWAGYGWIIGAELGPKWTINSDEDIDWYEVTTPGIVMVGTDHEVKALNPETGNVLWAKQCRKGVKWGCFEPIPGTPLAVLTMQKKVFNDDPFVAMINIATGEELWHSSAFGLGESYGHFVIPHLSALMFYGKQAEEPKKNLVVLVDLLTGDVIWKHLEMFKKWDPHLFEIGDRETIVGNQEPLFDTDSTMILLLNKKSVRKYNVRTGELVWDSKEKLKRKKSFFEKTKEKDDYPCSGLMLGFAPMLLSHDGAIVYAPYQNIVGAFRTSDGHNIWDDQEKLRGIATEMYETEHGLLVKCWDGDYTELKMLDFAIGKKLWKAPQGKGSVLKKLLSGAWGATSNLIVEVSAIWIATTDDVIRVNPSTGTTENKLPLGFDGIEEYLWIEPLDNGYLVSGLQNLVWFSPEWEKQNHVYFRPADNIGAGLFSLATALTMNAIGTRDLSDNVTVTLAGDTWGALKTMMEDFEASSGGDGYMYILAEPLDGEYAGLCLLRVSKSDGSVAGRIKLHTREPDYQLNLRQSSLVMKTEDKKLVDYQF